MPYIGSSASPLPVNFSAVQSQSFSGTGSQVAFTLSRTVPSTAALEVLVNNVQQSPYDGSYSITGTTLTFDEAPAAGTNNVYVIYRDQALGSLVDQTAYRSGEVDTLLAAKVNKAGDTMSGVLDISQVARNTNALRIGASAASTGYGFRIGASGATDPLEIWRDHPINGSQMNLSIDYSGRVTMPYQPAFLARGSKSHAGSWRVVSDGLTTIEHNIGGHFNSSTGRFTAPIAGQYAFYAGGYLESQALNERYGIAVPINAGGRPMITGGGAPSVDTPMSAHFIIRNLAAGDFVTLDVFLPTARSIGTGAHSLWFGGHLIS
jgi:hypothetical protein